MNIKVLRAEFDARIVKFRKGLKKADDAFSNFVGRFVYYGRRAAVALKPIAIGLAVLSTAIAGLVIATTKMAANFSNKMAQVRTLILKLPVKRFAELREGIKQLAMDSGKKLGSLAKALYEVISAGVGVRKAMGVLRTAVKMGVAGNASAIESFKLISAVVKGFGESWENAGKISDWAFKVVEQGQTTISELAGYIGRVLPFAKALGIELKNVGGQFATLTGVTGDTAEVSTQIRGIYASLINATDEVKKKAKALGFAWGAQAVKAKGLGTVLREMADATGGNVELMKEFIPQIEALPAALVLATTGADTLAEKTRAIGDAAGATKDAHAIMAEELSFKWDQLVETLKVIGTDIGEAFVTPVGKVVTKMAEWLEKNREFVKQKAHEAVDKLVTAVTDLQNWWQTGGQETLAELGASLGTIAGALKEIARWGGAINWPKHLIPKSIREAAKFSEGVEGPMFDRDFMLDPLGPRRARAPGRRGRPPIITLPGAAARDKEKETIETETVPALKGLADAAQAAAANLPHFRPTAAYKKAMEAEQGLLRKLFPGADDMMGGLPPGGWMPGKGTGVAAEGGGWNRRGGIGTILHQAFAGMAATARHDGWLSGEEGGIGPKLADELRKTFAREDQKKAADELKEAADALKEAGEELQEAAEGDEGRGIGRWPAGMFGAFSQAMAQTPRYDWSRSTLPGFDRLYRSRRASQVSELTA